MHTAWHFFITPDFVIKAHTNKMIIQFSEVIKDRQVLKEKHT